jgi:pyruvate/2-oxoglutarate dehydrogenase complex dihydrolipoamide dehydrogenase (E3) component
MLQSERLEILVLGSGVGGKLIAWHMAQSGRRTAVVERRWVGSSCPNIACNCQLEEDALYTTAAASAPDRGLFWGQHVFVARACHNVRR